MGPPTGACHELAQNIQVSKTDDTYTSVLLSTWNAPTQSNHAEPHVTHGQSGVHRQTDVGTCLRATPEASSRIQRVSARHK